MPDETFVNDELLERYLAVIQLNPSPGAWAKQTEYKRGWITINKEPCTTSNIKEMLEHRYWIASRAPADGFTDRIAFDLDAKDASDMDNLFARYAVIRELFGYDRLPLVYHTPSGCGVRIVYRIPRTPLSELVVGARAGLLADVLRGADLPVRAGKIEVFPQVRMPERLPLGRAMPLLDPDDLSKLSWAAIGDSFDRDLLRQAIEEMEAWHAVPNAGLIDHLRGLPRVAVDAPNATALASTKGRPRKHTLEPPASLKRLALEGLTEKGSRYAAEWNVGSAFVRWPLAFPEYGLGTSPSDLEIADALSHWVADRSNGLSREWADAVKGASSREEAIDKWRDRYLRRGPDGRSMIARLRMAAMLADPGLMPVAEVSDEEAGEILEWAEENFEPSAIRYRFEIWTWSAFRWLKAKCLKDARLGTLPLNRAAEDDQPFVDYDLPARTMERWPFGGGRSRKTQRPRYVEYSRILQKIGWMRWKSGYYNPRRFNRRLPDDIKGKAKTFTFPLPSLTLRAKDLWVSQGTIDEIIRQVEPRMDEPISRAEAYHALYVAANVPNLLQRYKRATADRLRKTANEIRSRAKL